MTDDTPKKRSPHFTVTLAKAMRAAVEAGIPIEVRLGVPSSGQDAAAAGVTNFAKWKADHAS